jgi:hypothetical protein
MRRDARTECETLASHVCPRARAFSFAAAARASLALAANVLGALSSAARRRSSRASRVSSRMVDAERSA